MSTLWVRSISARVMTDVAGSASSIAWVCRAGVITVVGNCGVASRQRRVDRQKEKRDRGKAAACRR